MACKNNIIKDNSGKIKVVSKNSKYFGESKVCGGMICVSISYQKDYGSCACSCCTNSYPEYHLVCAKCKQTLRTFGLYEVEDILQKLVDEENQNVLP